MLPPWSIAEFWTTVDHKIQWFQRGQFPRVIQGSTVTQRGLAIFRPTFIEVRTGVDWCLLQRLVKDSYQYLILQESVWYALNFFVGIVPMGIIISWICKTHGSSVLATIVFHFIVNLSQEALAMTQMTKCIETGVLTVIALGILQVERRRLRPGEHVLTSGPHAEAV